MGAEPADTLYDESAVPKYQLPALLEDSLGRRVESEADWVDGRREEVLGLFEEHVYGKTPARRLSVTSKVIESAPNALNGLATRRQVALEFANGALRVDLLIYIPNASRNDGPVPAFMGLNFYGNQTVCDDPKIAINPRWMRGNAAIGIEGHRATERTRGVYSSRWQVERLLKRGYALVTLYCGDIDPDNYRHDYSDGVHPLFYESEQTEPEDHEWGSIGAWAWGLSRAMDYVESVSEIDASRVAVLGHSRLGKTALWAGAQDERFALVISNNSGCGGAALYRRLYGERIHHMVGPVGYWFCKRHATYQKRESALPVDQHMLLALIAPRPLYVASATEDRWADPRGEFLAAVGASPVYELFGWEALGAAEFPEPDSPIHTRIGYHLREGEHDVTAYDWERYLDFADSQLH